jgi:hypothetical protein
MITFLGISLTYEALGFFLLFIISELIGVNPKLADNSVAQFILHFARISKYGRKEDDKLNEIADILKR